MKAASIRILPTTPPGELTFGFVVRTTVQILGARAALLGIAAWVAFGPFAYSDVLSAVRGEAAPMWCTWAYVMVRCGFWGLTAHVARDALLGTERSLSAVARATARSWGLLIALDVAVGMLTLVGVAALIVPGLWAAARFWLAPLACMIERKGVLASIRRSVELTRGRLPTLAAMGALQLGLYAAMTAPALMAHEGELSTLARALLAILGAVMAPLAFAVSATGAAVVYHHAASTTTRPLRF